MNKRIGACIASFLCVATIFGQEMIVPSYKGHKLKDLEVLHAHDNFMVYDTKTKTRKKINRYDVERSLRFVKNEDLVKFLRHATIQLKKVGRDDYKIESHVRGNGGGWLTACAFYSITKSFLWAVPGYAIKSIILDNIKSGTKDILPPVVEHAAENLVDNTLLKPMKYMQDTGNPVCDAGGTFAAQQFVESRFACKESIALGTLQSVAGNPASVFNGYSVFVETCSNGAYALGMWLPLP